MEQWIKLKDLKAWIGSWISWLNNKDNPKAGYIVIEEYLKRLLKRLYWNNRRKLKDNRVFFSIFL
jgi:hypothetical protein